MLVPEKHLTRVAGMNQTMQGFSNILAPPMAAVLIAFMPIQQVLVFDILAVSIAITILLFIKFPEPAPKTGPRQKVIADMKEAFAYLRGWHGALTMMCMFMAINMLITPAFNLMSILVRNTFNGGAIDFATLEAAAGIGMISGGLALSIWGGTKRKIVTIMSATILAGVGITLMTLVPHNGFLLMVGLVFFVGIVMVMLNGSLMSLLQSCIPKGIQGRVLSLMGSISVGAAPIGMVFAGPITDGMGIQFWFLIAGISTALIGLTAFFLPSVMRIEDPSSQPEYSEKTPEAQISPETDV
jgi:DHA3 family macrolide efflux protein-like MFS transporter